MSGHLRLVLEDEQAKAWNMAADQALLELSRDPVLRIYSWKPEKSGLPAMSIGYLDSWESVPADRSFVRRMTGGGLVDHACDFTYSIVVPQLWIQAWDFKVEQSYSFFHTLLAEALKGLGLEARLAGKEDVCEGIGACFAKPVLSDLLELKTQRKVAGAAQRRNRYGLLHQGSVLGKQWTASEKKSLGWRLAELLSTSWNLALQESVMSSDEMRLAKRWESSRYETDSWNKKN